MLRLLTLLFITTLFAACGGPEGTEVETGPAEAAAAEAVDAPSQDYTVDAAQSVVNWEGTKLIGGGHTGTIPVTGGQLITVGNQVVGGRFSLDIDGIENTDLDADGAAKLIGHLKSKDFFETETYPVATFEITKTKRLEESTSGLTHEITGNLVMHGQERSVTIPATIVQDGKMLKASSPKFVIDRKEWDIVYGSGSLEGIAQDKIINDNVGLELMLVANLN